MTESTYEDPSVRNAIAATVTAGKCVRRWVAEIALCPDCRRPAGDHDNLPELTPRWVDAGGGVWEEHPTDPMRIRFVHDADGKSPTHSDWWPKAHVVKQFGGLTPQVTEDDGMIVTTASGPRHVKPGDRLRHVNTHQTGTVGGVGPNTLVIKIDDDVKGAWFGASWFWEPLPAEDTGVSTDTAVEVYLNGEFIRSGPETPEQRKILAAADELEDLVVMMNHAVSDLRSAARVTGANAADPLRASRDAYARVYTLRRKLTQVVATLGAGKPARLAGYVAEYDAIALDARRRRG